MHKLKILIFAPDSFISTLNEVKFFLKFNFSTGNKNELKKLSGNFDGFLCHEENFKHFNVKEILNNEQFFKILVTNNGKNYKIFDATVKLPISLKEINNIIESTAAKKKFGKNSSINIKSYMLNKNEKKLIKQNDFIILTEKEIQLLELFLVTAKPISKIEILSKVWQYSSDADTHTVETHIYRLRKKVAKKFFDEKFILNNKTGYYL